jgi:hypothetical protein
MPHTIWKLRVRNHRRDHSASENSVLSWKLGAIVCAQIKLHRQDTNHASDECHQFIFS